MLDRWSGYDPAKDRIRVALLRLYTEVERDPTAATLAVRAGLSETAIRPLLEGLFCRDLIVLDGGRIVGCRGPDLE